MHLKLKIKKDKPCNLKDFKASETKNQKKQ